MTARLIRIAVLALVGFTTAHAQGNTRPSAVTLRFDYGAADALLAALERTALSDAEVDGLLRVHGVRAMVDNVTRFVPSEGLSQFREDAKAFAPKKRPNRRNSPFQLADVWRQREATRAVLEKIRAREPEITSKALGRLKRYPLNTGPLAITVYVVVGGVSDGFVPDQQAAPAFYINLTRSGDDIDGLVENVAHEAYHVMQKAALRRVPGHAAHADSSERLAAPLRLLAVTLSEGLANYVVDPQRSSGDGKQIEASRRRYRRNAEPKRITENFALFDRVLGDLRAGRASWEDAYTKGFSGNNDARFYFVGYQMAKAIEQHCGAACIGVLFEQPPVEFFRSYITLYRVHAGIRGRFAPATEAFLLSGEAGRR
jgi:hypothetical protein